MLLGLGLVLRLKVQEEFLHICHTTDGLFVGFRLSGELADVSRSAFGGVRVSVF